MSEHIKIGDQKPWVQYPVDYPNQEDFSFDFPIFEAADLEVYVDDSLKVLGADYTVEAAQTGGLGWVEFSVSPPVGSFVTIRRRLTIQRLSDFQESGEFRAKVLNDELDYQTAAIQQVADDVTRTLRLPATDPDSGLVLPDKETRRNGFLAFDSEGAPVSMIGISEEPVSPFMEGVMGVADADALLTAMALTPVSQDFVVGADGIGNMEVPFELSHEPSSAADILVWFNNVPQIANWTLDERNLHFDFTPADGDRVHIRYRTGDV